MSCRVTVLDWTVSVGGGYLRVILWRHRFSWLPGVGGFGGSRAVVLMLPWLWIEVSPDPPGA